VNQPEYPLLRDLGLQDYEPVWRQMQHFNRTRDDQTRDEIWFLQHRPVFTLGMSASADHVLMPGDIPVIDIDRGGQVTYHGPGQLVVYPLLNLKRLQLGVRALVTALEQSIVDTLAKYDIVAVPRADAPGVYVSGAKIASIGLRVRRDCSYHGLAFNIDMDLDPFKRINPCGFEGLEITQIAALGGPAKITVVRDDLARQLLEKLGYNAPPKISFLGEPETTERAT